MRNKYLFICTAGLLTLVPSVYGGKDTASPRALEKSVWGLDYKSLPSDAHFHHRTKWSNGWFIYLDDDASGPSVYVFDRTGQIKYSTMIQISGVDRMRLEDFAAMPDGSMWACGNATSQTGQRTFFLAHIMQDGADLRIIQIPSYSPYQLSAAPNGDVWTVGYGIKRDAGGDMQIDKDQNVLRRFNASGELIASAIPARTIDVKRISSGFLIASSDRVGWYSPKHGNGSYVELSPDMRLLDSYSGVPTTDGTSMIRGFVLTPAGRVFATSREDGPRVLQELDRIANKWLLVEFPRDARGDVPMLKGNDGESLVFTGLPDTSKLRVFAISKQ